MSIPCKFERSLLSHDEHEIVASTHHPAIYDAGPDDLKSLLKRLRDLRDKERTLSRGKQREARGKGAARGATFPGTAEHPYRRKQVFVFGAQARRQGDYRAKTSLWRVPRMPSLRSAPWPCAARRSSRIARPPDTPHMRECAPLPSQRRRTKVPPAKIGQCLAGDAQRAGKARRSQLRTSDWGSSARRRSGCRRRRSEPSAPRR